MPLASLGALLLGIRLAAFFISRCWVTFCALSFAVVFSVVGSLLFSALVSFVFVGDVFVLLMRVHPLRGRVRDFIGSGRTGRKFSWRFGKYADL